MTGWRNNVTLFKAFIWDGQSILWWHVKRSEFSADHLQSGGGGEGGITGNDSCRWSGRGSSWENVSARVTLSSKPTTPCIRWPLSIDITRFIVCLILELALDNASFANQRSSQLNGKLLNLLGPDFIGRESRLLIWGARPHGGGKSIIHGNTDPYRTAYTDLHTAHTTQTYTQHTAHTTHNTAHTTH